MPERDLINWNVAEWDSEYAASPAMYRPELSDEIPSDVDEKKMLHILAISNDEGQSAIIGVPLPIWNKWSDFDKASARGVWLATLTREIQQHWDRLGRDKQNGGNAYG